ncbi:hypothetical protein VHEMI06066 [[Torrubiella] hemipterigena]|uniref:Serine carboxypeptidase n=1 Tax=[Torrubiella] hemipterigena TaxID=1531966 RepID=A0A0A1TKA0_9HYPO|nr:hypothetical protein VHEMI06066 [[Torrubiella] hemipterigena]
MKFASSIAFVVASSLALAMAQSKPRYLNEKSAKFAVNGTGIPNVPFDIGESYAGHLPVSSNLNETDFVYFWFLPSQDTDVNDEIAIWMDGLGCTPQADAISQNGPFLWKDGTPRPAKNLYTWHNLTNVVYVDAPHKAASLSEPTDQVAAEFKGSWKNFVDTFQLKGYQVFMHGELDGGQYIPYIAESFLDDENKDYFDLKGMTLNNPNIGSLLLQEEYPMVPFFNTWSRLLGTDDDTMKIINDLYNKGPQPAYTEKYFRFPPPQVPFPEPPLYREYFSYTSQSLHNANPCFTGENIADRCPYLESHLGNHDELDIYNPANKNWYLRPDVSAALHYKPSYEFGCNFHLTQIYTDPAGDGTLGRVIDKTHNVIIGAGALAYNRFANGTLFQLQNVTWGGEQGFHNYPVKPISIPDHWNENTEARGAKGFVGRYVQERGLTFFIANAGGMHLYGNAPTLGYRMIQQSLGHISNFSSTAPLF